jgi:lipopolysaccharide transport system ATP-binding protein
MNSDTAISVVNLGKSYVIKHQNRSQYNTLRESLLEVGRGLFSSKKRDESSAEVFWALRDISFNVRRGEVLGIIGRNGAGKSTLLKILSRITEPTKGYAEINGRVGSLLEVGTGFNPELTGRENIYLNGTILGMRRNQISKLFDQIVDFAGVEKFLDTPVKRYSSGMYVRLAFAVAAHLEPDVLIIDEVLAVGDMQFQKKCLSRMKDVTNQGRTVLFVSHSITAVNSLCDRCLLLNRGEVEMQGPTEMVTTQYFSELNSEGGTSICFSEGEMPGDAEAKLCSAKLVDRTGLNIKFGHIDRDIGVEIHFVVLMNQLECIPNFHVFTRGQCVFVSAPKIKNSFQAGYHRATMWIPKHFLNEGTYIVNIALSTMNPQRVHFHLIDHFFFQIVDNIHSEDRNGYVHAVPGFIRPKMDWEMSQ